VSPYTSSWSGPPSSVRDIVERLHAEQYVTVIDVDHEEGLVTVRTVESDDIERVRKLLEPLGWWQRGSVPMS
jgi:hypothetical protein